MKLDCIGAMISALMLGIFLVEFQDYIGMPKMVLYSLASLALVFAIYSFSCYFIIRTITKSHIRIIAYANLFYCSITLLLVVIYFEQMTILGVVYFIGEVPIIAGLAIVEFKTASTLDKAVG